jgi:hypothetical protein
MDYPFGKRWLIVIWENNGTRVLRCRIWYGLAFGILTVWFGSGALGIYFSLVKLCSKPGKLRIGSFLREVYGGGVSCVFVKHNFTTQGRCGRCSGGPMTQDLF